MPALLPALLSITGGAGCGGGSVGIADIGKGRSSSGEDIRGSEGVVVGRGRGGAAAAEGGGEVEGGGDGSGGGDGDGDGDGDSVDGVDGDGKSAGGGDDSAEWPAGTSRPSVGDQT